MISSVLEENAFLTFYSESVHNMVPCVLVVAWGF